MNKANKVKAHVGSLVVVGKRFTHAWGRASAGKKLSETHITFLDVQTLLETLSPRRLELLKFVRQHGAENTKELALTLKRDYKNVHGDVAVLVSAGLSLREGRKLSAPWDELNLNLAAGHGRGADEAGLQARRECPPGLPVRGGGRATTPQA